MFVAARLVLLAAVPSFADELVAVAETSANALEGDESCALQVKRQQDHADGCALCFNCGGDFPIDGGRVTYFQDYTTKFYSYGEECSGQNRERTGDGTVIFSPRLCCTAAYDEDLLEVRTQTLAEAEVSEHSELSAVDKVDSRKAAGDGRRRRKESSDDGRRRRKESSDDGELGWCRLCDQCGSGYGKWAGSITELTTAGSNSNSQNFVRYTGYCSAFSASGEAPPGAQVCCKSRLTSNQGMCSVCQGKCGGAYRTDSGVLSYTEEGEMFVFQGRGFECSGSYPTTRTGWGMSDAPRLCCA